MMPLICPQCQRGTLRVETSLELPPDARSDEISVQIVECSACGFEGVGVYRESRRGALDDEVVDHVCHTATPEVLSRIHGLIGRCRRQGDASCSCAAHRALRAIASLAEREQQFPGVAWDIPHPIRFTR